METNYKIIKVLSFNVFQNNKICSISDYTVFLWETHESLFSIHQQGTQKEKMLTSEPRMRSIHYRVVLVLQNTKNCRKNLNYLPF